MTDSSRGLAKSMQTRAGHARARAAGVVLGRPVRHTDTEIREASTGLQFKDAALVLGLTVPGVWKRRQRMLRSPDGT